MPAKLLYLGFGIVMAGVLALQILRWLDLRREKLAWSNLAIAAAVPSRYFDPSMVSALPDPARRYFLFAIAPGTRLSGAAELVMGDELSLGTKEKPNYMQMQARQILVAGSGFVWRVSVGSRKVWISGSDGYVSGEGWTRFWLYNLLPVVRAGGGKDYARSAAGRSLAESLFWLPSTLLPSKEVRWEPVNADTARAVVTHQGGQHIVELKVASDGRPLSVWIMRWSRENEQRKWQLQPFGGTIEVIREQDGYRVAGLVRGGNWFGTDRYFPFYKARLNSIRFF
jgi:hypothetical protein